MKGLFRVAALIGLGLVIVPPVYFDADAAAAGAMKTLMLVGTALWFAGSFLGFRQNAEVRELEEEHTPVA